MFPFITTHSFLKIDDGPINMTLLIFFNRKDTYGDTHELINRKKKYTTILFENRELCSLERYFGKPRDFVVKCYENVGKYSWKDSMTITFKSN